MWELTKAQTSYGLSQVSEPIQQLLEGHYKQGIHDAMNAIIRPDVESPADHVLRGMVLDYLHGIKDAGAEELEAFKEGYNTLTARTPEERTAHWTQAKGQAAGTVLSEIKGVAPGVVESGAEIGNPETRMHGIGGMIGEGAMVVGPEAAGRVMEAAGPAAGRAAESFGMKKFGGLLKATNPREYWFGADPRKTIVD